MKECLTGRRQNIGLIHLFLVGTRQQAISIKDWMSPSSPTRWCLSYRSMWCYRSLLSRRCRWLSDKWTRQTTRVVPQVLSTLVVENKGDPIVFLVLRLTTVMSEPQSNCNFTAILLNIMDMYFLRQLPYCTVCMAFVDEDSSSFRQRTSCLMRSNRDSLRTASRCWRWLTVCWWLNSSGCLITSTVVSTRWPALPGWWC